MTDRERQESLRTGLSRLSFSDLKAIRDFALIEESAYETSGRDDLAADSKALYSAIGEYYYAIHRATTLEMEHRLQEVFPTLQDPFDVDMSQVPLIGRVASEIEDDNEFPDTIE